MTVDVSDIVVCETPCHLADGVGFTNVREELVAHPLTFASAFDDSGDVDEGHRRRNGLSGMKHLRQHIEALVRHPDHANIRLNGREGVVRRQDVILGQRVEQSRLAGVGKTDDSNRKCHVRPLYRSARTQPTSHLPSALHAGTSGHMLEAQSMWPNTLGHIDWTWNQSAQAPAQ